MKFLRLLNCRNGCSSGMARVGAALGMLAVAAGCGSPGGPATPTAESQPTPHCNSESMFSTELWTRDESLAQELSQQLSRVPGVRSVVFAGKMVRIRVSPEFVEPKLGWATEMGAEIYRSCVPTELFSAAEQVMEDLGGPALAGSANFGLGSDNIDVAVASTFDPETVRSAILERFGHPIEEYFLNVHAIPVVQPAILP